MIYKKWQNFTISWFAGYNANQQFHNFVPLQMTIISTIIYIVNTDSWLINVYSTKTNFDNFAVSTAGNKATVEQKIVVTCSFIFSELWQFSVPPSQYNATFHQAYLSLCNLYQNKYIYIWN